MFIKNIILQNLKHTPTKSQTATIDKLIGFFDDRDKQTVFILKGYAGTGKTTLISALTKTMQLIKQKTILMAPTGRAAKVLGLYADSMASTIHKCIYRKQSTQNYDSGFVLNYKKYKQTLFIVDEASMISNENLSGGFFGSGNLLNDLLQFVFSNDNCKLIIAGDTAQLPPVGTTLSPALDPIFFKSQGYKVYLSELTDVVRQESDSGILTNATLLRQNINLDNCNDYPKLQTDGFADIVKANGAELQDVLEESFSNYGIDETKIITRSNKYANKYNLGIRSRLLWKEEEVSSGDLLMVVKNNYSQLDEKSPIDFIANGDIVEVKRIRNYQEIYGYRFADVLIGFADYPDFEIESKVLLDSLSVESPAMPQSYYKDIYEKLNEDYQDISDAKKRHESILKDDYFNALQVKFAYAITCHKSQGGQWKCVCIDYGWLNADMVNTDFYRWLYTAMTRASDKIYLINFDEKFFDNDIEL